MYKCACDEQVWVELPVDKTMDHGSETAVLQVKLEKYRWLDSLGCSSQF
jgi:hypothetical protein